VRTGRVISAGYSQCKNQCDRGQHRSARRVRHRPYARPNPCGRGEHSTGTRSPCVGCDDGIIEWAAAARQPVVSGAILPFVPLPTGVAVAWLLGQSVARCDSEDSREAAPLRGLYPESESTGSARESASVGILATPAGQDRWRRTGRPDLALLLDHLMDESAVVEVYDGR
jgi:hypothetical protein